MEKHDGHEKEGRQEILMGRTRTTRPKGNGPGHGGPASGASASGAGYGPGAGAAKSFAANHQPSGEAKSAGKEVAAEIKAKIAEHKDAILEAQLARAKDAAHPQGHAAAEALLNRIMPPETKQTVSGDADAPLAFTIVTGVPRAED
jgi:hypothetical protein